MPLYFNKFIIEKTLLIFVHISLVIIVIANFFILKHIAVTSISLLTLIVANLGLIILRKKNNFNTEIKYYLFSSIGIICIYLIGILIHNEEINCLRYNLQLRTIIVGYAIAIVTLPKFSKTSYYTIFLVFIATNIFYSLIMAYNYYYEVFVLNGFNVYNKEWIYSIDKLIPLISPYYIWHHTLAFFFVFSLVLLFEIENFNYRIKLFKISLVIIIGIIIHLLGSKLGVILFYFVVFYQLIKKLDSIKSFLFKSLIVIIIFSPLVLLNPIFKHRFNDFIRQIKIELSYNRNAKIPSRMLSYAVGFDIISKNPLKGISFCKSDSYFNEYFKNKYPNFLTFDYIRPHNQFIYYACLIGIPLTILFVILIYLPLLFLYKYKSLVIIYLFHTFYCFVDMPFNLKEYFYFYSFWFPFFANYLINNKIIRHNERK